MHLSTCLDFFINLQTKICFHFVIIGQCVDFCIKKHDFPVDCSIACHNKCEAGFYWEKKLFSLEK